MLDTFTEDRILTAVQELTVDQTSLSNKIKQIEDAESEAITQVTFSAILNELTPVLNRLITKFPKDINKLSPFSYLYLSDLEVSVPIILNQYEVGEETIPGSNVAAYVDDEGQIQTLSDSITIKNCFTVTVWSTFSGAQWTEYNNSKMWVDLDTKVVYTKI